MLRRILALSLVCCLPVSAAGKKRHLPLAQRVAQGAAVRVELAPGRHVAAVRATAGHTVALVATPVVEAKAVEPAAGDRESGRQVLLAEGRSFPTLALIPTTRKSIRTALIRPHG